MSEDKEQKYLGNAKLSQKPERKLVLRLGKDAVKEENIKDGAVTMAKLGDDITNWLAKQVQDIESGAIYFRQDLGDGESIGISQKTLTNYINDLQSQIELLKSHVIVIQFWGAEAPVSEGSYRYDPETNTLYYGKKVTTYSEPEDGISIPDTSFEWEALPLNRKTAYLRGDTLEWYEYLGEGLVPIGIHRVDISELDTFININDLRNSSAAAYAVVDKKTGINTDTKVGILSLLASFDEETITQIFTTQYIPIDGAFVSTNESSDVPKTYYRKGTNWESLDNVSVINIQWTPWQEVSAHIDIDDEFKETSENPIMNKILTAKFEEVQKILDSETKIRYFDDYDENEGVVYSDVNYTSSNGSIVYVVNDNKFALRDGTSYYLNWSVNGTREYDQDEYNAEDSYARTDRNFLLLAERNTLPTAQDIDTIKEAVNNISPLIVEYYVSNIDSEGVISASIMDESCTYSNIKNAFVKGKNVILKKSTNTSSLGIGADVFVLTHFDSFNSSNTSLVCNVSLESGDYSIKINKISDGEGEHQASIEIIKKENLTYSAIIVNNNSRLDVNTSLETQVSQKNLIPNSDGSIWIYSFKSAGGAPSSRLKKYANTDAAINGAKAVNPSVNTLYIDAHTNTLYRWDNDAKDYKVAGGAGADLYNTLEVKVLRLETLLGLNDQTNKLERLDTIEETIGEDGEDGSGMLQELAQLRSYKSDVIEPAVSNLGHPANTTGNIEAAGVFAILETKADKGHEVIILSFCETPIASDSLIYLSGQEAIDLNRSMPNGIYWLDPTRQILRKGTLNSGTGIINWNEVTLSKEALYVDKENKKLYVYSVDKNNSGGTIMEVPSSLRKVGIILEGGSGNEEITINYNSISKSYTPRRATTNPEGYSVRIMVDNNEYTEGAVTLTVGSHLIEYILEAGYGYEGSTVSYTVTVRQEERPQEEPFIMSVGNKGNINIAKAPENIEISDVVNAYPIPKLYSDCIIEENYRSGSAYTGQPHLYTAEEIGLQEVSSNNSASVNTQIAKNNFSKIKTAIEKDDCIGFKLDQLWAVWLEYISKRDDNGNLVLKEGNRQNIDSVDYNTNIHSFYDSDGMIILPKDFIIIGGESNGQATGGFINWKGGQGTMFLTDHSLYLYKVRICSSQVRSYKVPAITVDARKGIDQIQVIGCKIESSEGSSNPGGVAIGLYFNDEDPLETIDNKFYIKQTNRINHLNIDGNICEKELLHNFSKTHCIVKSCRIINNTITNVLDKGIDMSTFNSLTYENKLTYVSCPIWIVNNAISGTNDVFRGNSNYYVAYCVENSSTYILYNTFSNFIAGYTGESGTSTTSCHDGYFNGKQYYFCNNTVINAGISFTNMQSYAGVIKAKSVGYTENYSATELVAPVRIIRKNKFLINPIEVKYIWNNKSVANSNDSTVNMEKALSIFFQCPTDAVSIKEFDFSKNIVNALWNGNINDYLSTIEYNSNVYGNILGIKTGHEWRATSFKAEDNIFIAYNMPSTEWGYYYDQNLSGTWTYIFSFIPDNTFVDPQENPTTSLIINRNLFYKKNLEEGEKIKILESKYFPPASESTARTGNFQCAGNNTLEGTFLRIDAYKFGQTSGNYNTGSIFPAIEEITGTLPVNNTSELFDHGTGNLGTVTIPSGPAESINYSDINRCNITDIYDSYKIEKDGEMVYPTTDDVGIGSIIPHLWNAEEIGLIDIPDTSAPDARSNANTNTTLILNAMSNDSCIGFKLDKQYWVNHALLPNIEDPSEVYLYHFTDILPFVRSAIEIPKDFIIDGEVGDEAEGGFIQFDGGQGAMFYTTHSLYVNKMYVRSPCVWEYDIPYFCIDCRQGIEQIQFIDCKFDRYNGVAKYAAGMYIGLWIDNIDPLDSNSCQIASNYINHVYIKGCDVLGNFIGCGENGYRILKSCRITGNTIHDIRNIGINLAPLRLKQRPNRDGEYASKNAYVSCPIWMYENVFVGIDPVVESGVVSMGKIKRPPYDIFCGALIESNVLYSLGNTFTDFVTAPSVYQHGGNTGSATEYSQIRCASTYDQYFNGRQLYYANNTVHNVINLFESQGTNGCFTAEKVGYHVPATTLPVIRYYANNNIELCPYEVKTYWGEQNENKNNDPITIARIASENVTTATDNINTIIVENEKAVSLNTWMNIKINAKYVDADCPIDELTIINNTFNAIVENAQYNGNHIVGNIDGMRNVDSLYAYKVTITGNTFKADNIASEEWGHYFLEDGNYINNNSTWLLSLGLVRNQDNNLLTISDNEVYVKGNTSQNVHLCLIKYGLGDAQYITNADGAYYTSSNNNITSGKTLLIGKIDAQGWRTQFKESIEGSLSAEE